MSDIALYRKYRPSTFSEVMGQDHVIEVLKGAIKQDTTTHAYLFAGPRGTGKTSIARIMARELGASANDIYEIDAASNRGVDEIRELREAVRTLPFESPVKVYIIDEVHMLTTPAFNALLKTLEEPPKHVVFILATTDLHKLPETIISRCQTFTFKRLNITDLAKIAKSIAKSEGYSLETDAAQLIALLGEGAVRDTIGILQKVIGSLPAGEITRDRVEMITGAPKTALVHDYLQALLAKNTENALKALQAAIDDSSDVAVFLKIALRETRTAMLIKFAPALKADFTDGLSKEELAALEALTNHQNSLTLPAILKEFLAAHQAMGSYYLPQIALELVAVKVGTQG